MAKSLRSKWKRKCRAVKRVRYGQRELERLKNALNNDPLNKPKDEEMQDISEVATVVDKKSMTKNEEGVDQNTEDVMDEMESDVKKRSFSMKTMRDENGTYPVWLNKKKIQRAIGGKGKSKKKKIRRRGK